MLKPGKATSNEGNTLRDNLGKIKLLCNTITKPTNGTDILEKNLKNCYYDNDKK